MKKLALLLCAGSLAAVAAMAQDSSSSSAVAPPPPPFGPVVGPGRTLQTADMINANPLIPGDIYRNGAVAHQDLATFAWLEFISAVSPNAAGYRGVPGGSFAASGSGASTGPLVWETYQHRTELLPCNAVSSPTGPTTSPIAPQPWGASPKYVTTASSTQLCSTITLPGGGPLPFNNLDEANQIGQNTLFYPTTPGRPQPTADAQVLFEAKVNQYESNYVNQNYASFIPKFGPFHLSPGITLPNTTVEVKAAWRPVSSIPSNQRYRYHIANVLTYAGTDAAPVPKVVPYALIALHIIHKTPNYPSFIFATFEQVDDFTNQVTGQPTGVYYVPAYGAVAYTTPPTTTFPPSGKTVPNPNIGFNTAAPKAMPYGVPGGVALPLGNTLSFPGAKPVSGGRVAIPVTSPVPTVPEVATVNGQALAAMKGIPGFNQNFKWQYYKLTGVQAVPTNDETSRDFYLANIVVESSQPGIQLFRGFPPIAPNPKTKVPTLTNIRNQVNVIDYHTGASTLAPTLTSSGGCQGCHGIAQTQNGFDFSFLFFGVNGGGFTPETAGLPTPQVSAVRLANKKYFQK